MANNIHDDGDDDDKDNNNNNNKAFDNSIDHSSYGFFDDGNNN